ncbi:MAG: hypothetical protein JRF57_15865 [Deltaproteobacteria bacterium]|nr:hypothetical protein [Deltaproteobacteria bacterium]
MKEPLSLDGLWSSARPGARDFDPALVSGLPEGARSYLGHAIAAGTPLASAVRLRMHGEIRLKGWHPFTAEQVILWNRGMIWRATVRMFGMPIRGGDFFLDGQGTMRWKLFGILPIVNAAGPDISRSTAGRMNIESVWLPSVLCGEGVSWTAAGKRLHARFAAHGESAEIDFTVNADGQIETVSMPRWGNPEGDAFHYVRCGGFVEEEDTFAGYTIPTRMRVGWHFGTDGFEQEGEFFRVTIDDAIYR